MNSNEKILVQLSSSFNALQANEIKSIYTVDETELYIDFSGLTLFVGFNDTLPFEVQNLTKSNDFYKCFFVLCSFSGLIHTVDIETF
jgi:hypothetical protein